MSQRRARVVVVLVGAVALIVLAAAWARRPASSEPATSEAIGDRVPVGVAGRAWQIHSVDGRTLRRGFDDAIWFRLSDDPAPGVMAADIPDGFVHLDGHDGCNRYSGGARLDGDRVVEVVPGISTAMACRRPIYGPGTGTLELDDGWLTLRGPRTVVAFDRIAGAPSTEPPVVQEVDVPLPTAPLATVPFDTEQPLPEDWADRTGTRWTLTSVNGEPWRTSLVPSFTIVGGTIFQGHDGCHRYVGAWWLGGADDEQLVVSTSEPEDAVVCRADVEPFLRPTDGFHFDVGVDRIASRPFAAVPDADAAIPFVVFERLAPTEPVRSASQLVGEWLTLDGSGVSFSADGSITVEGCGAVATWTLDDRLHVDRRWPAYPACAALESPSFAMLLLDGRSPERLELLADGRLVHTSDMAITILQPAR